MAKILVVEDDPSLRDFFVFDFESQGFETFVASDGEEALRALAETEVDAVVSDVQMPKMSGLELAIALRQQSHQPTRPIIVLMTGHQEILAEEAYASGVTAFLYKPFHRQELSQLVQEHLVSRAERWPASASFARAEAYPKIGNLAIQVEQWEPGTQQKILHFGHGGLFIAMSESFPGVNARVDFKITSDNSSEPPLEGIAIVKWVRRLPSGEYPPGCGMEIIALHNPGAEKLLEFLKENRAISYIPRA